ncbi:Pkinase-domain-containing protein [Basidiobolus meristosporus CBS 931.73]|uniref:Pkinase-domain-containing protein n=1 Tax=Basidiobolus meristosporus CBS 931.73 TaxID=1314790 RepID=A0A1Y1WW59_9FUNG|nr:Pkinase-domain-containing protein [Basidiobolus meristosporus CBS 931.73]|eukprot:ORX77787.1 Pkinase-domain-containing protein [Basidiobolus meristosporus CBS 931.73]
MKRSGDDSIEDQHEHKHPPSYGTSPSNASNGTSQTVPVSPYIASSPSTASPLYKQRDSKKFTGCSRYEDYEIEKKLGEGTFGEVHKARHKVTGEVVALKRILMHNEKEGVPITALREIKILKSLNHINVINLTDMAILRGNRLHRQRGAIYMVFPYMDHDLAGLLENPNVSFTVPQIKLYMRQLLEGMMYLHNNKILHRDMKAANLLINNQGVLKIADFGLARPYDVELQKEYTNCVVTRWYRPPELLMGEKKYTTAIDMWGVGCVFGEILKGKPILPGSSDIDQLDRIFRLCGSPSEDSMPGWRELGGCESIKSFKFYARKLKDEFERYGTHAVDLLNKILVLDPKKRLTAREALDHDYFWYEPLPANPSDLPVYEASHEFNRRRQKQEEKPREGGNHQGNRNDPYGSFRQPYDNKRNGSSSYQDRRDRNGYSKSHNHSNNYKPHPLPPKPTARYEDAKK